MNLNENILRVKELMGIINEDLNRSITVYHGTPFEKSAEGIIENGLKTKGDVITVGGSGLTPIKNRSYLTNELWNAIRYSFFQPNSIEVDWDEYVKDEPYGYVFEFQKNMNELLPDEDAIGAIASEFINFGKNEFIGKYLKDIDEDLKTKVAKGSFDAFSELGKIIEPMLSDEDKMSILSNSFTFTTEKDLMPQVAYKIKKPPVKFFKTKQEYIDWFEKNHSSIKL